MKKILLTALCVLVGLIGAQRSEAEQVDFGAIGNFIRLNNNTLVPNGDIVMLGSFPTGFDFTVNTTFAQLTAAFTLYGTTVIGDAGSGFTPGEFFSSAGPVLPGVAGDRLYIWMFNSAVPANATQWAIISNPAAAWTRPVSGLTLNSIDASDAGTFVPIGALGSINGGTFDIRLGIVVIPEPSVMLLGALGLGLGLMALRARRARAA